MAGLMMPPAQTSGKRVSNAVRVYVSGGMPKQVPAAAVMGLQSAAIAPPPAVVEPIAYWPAASV
jgi:hypothetical protein